MTITRDEIRTLISEMLGSPDDMIAQALQQLLSRVETLEARLEIDHAYQFVNGQMVRFELPEDQRDTFPDKITCLEVEIAYLKPLLGGGRKRRRRLRANRVGPEQQLELEDYIKDIIQQKTAGD